MHRVQFETVATDGSARAGEATTANGTYSTPLFMPVGTRGAIKYLSAADYDALGAQIVLGNTYHLMLRPGAETIARFGGLASFAGWDGLTLTDSGGFQVFSLDPKVDDGGVTFKSTYDGTTYRFTPEQAIETQQLLGADIQMVLDVCPPLPSPPDVIRRAVDRTALWAERAQAHHSRTDQALFGIVQGGTSESMRAESAQRTVALGFDGYGIGGLSVGETREEMLPALAAAIAHLPADRPRYLMGVGDPASLVEAVGLGVDQFDCVMQTRLGRHGTALTARGRVNVKRNEFALTDDPIDPACACSVCARHSLGYIRHLFKVGEPTASRLVSLHNVAWTIDLMARMRVAILDGRFDALRADVLSVWG
ncbi:MAG: tRNA guanosine(34) transglycosylase Tgt [Ilumatobacter sp.]|uniref:tRNA guanosine(34) transglycosylase Tgt n=1 Tax=Ilumatobacter sp. TaxID=1967498 RepID=UPI00262F34A2|nr:tRNA guanosine(34) transglycosylase Tgt [Ilumatobacter sp.]MDJ0767389.1 tRNA guanosine(34) transglycosylase Tgt [Ilumatobacter sp.]